MLQPRGVVVVFGDGGFIGKRQSDVNLALVLVLVVAVAAHTLAAPALDGSEAILPDQLTDMVGDTVLIVEFFDVKGTSRLLTKDELDAGVDDRLTSEHLSEELLVHLDIGEDL